MSGTFQATASLAPTTAAAAFGPSASAHSASASRTSSGTTASISACSTCTPATTARSSAGSCNSGTYLVTWNGHGDGLALWRQNTDGSLTLANSYSYSTWGTPTTTVAAGFGDLGFRYLHVGASDVEWDNSLGLGLFYMHARHYSPLIGRFLQPDPVDGDKNVYAYAASNPVTTSDPTGQYLPIWVIGRLNEAFVVELLQESGWRITGQRVRLEGRYGPLPRYIDAVGVRNGVRVNFEIKFGTARYNWFQRFYDQLYYRITGIGTILIRVQPVGQGYVNRPGFRGDSADWISRGLWARA